MIGPVTGVQVNAEGRGDGLGVTVRVKITMRRGVGQPRHRPVVDQGDTEVGWLIQVGGQIPSPQARPGQGPGQDVPGLGWLGVVFIGHVVPIVPPHLISWLRRKDQADHRAVIGARQVAVNKT